MSEFKHFRIILHLTHFFQDHRSLCRIFVNEKMKHVGDLENHIQKIFNIKDFYFISNGHYVPPSEDIRILHPDEIIIAIPTNCIATDISITDSAIANKPALKEKHEKQYLEDYKDFSNMNVKKKKKRKTTTSNTILENEEERLYLNEKGCVPEHNIEFDNLEDNELQNDLKNYVLRSEKCENIHREHNDFDLPTLSMNLSSEAIEREEYSFSCSKDKSKVKDKLYSHKSKPDLSSHDQTKYLNISNILVSKIPSTTNISDSRCTNQIVSKNSEEFSYQMNNSFHNKHKQMNNVDNIADAIMESKDGEIGEVTSNSNHPCKTINAKFINTSEKSNFRQANKEKMEDASDKELNKAEEKQKNKSISLIQKYIDNDLALTKEVNKSSLTENLNFPFLAKDASQVDANSCSEENTLPDIDNTCSTLCDKYNTVTFITKRKRKRTHRKRKSKQSINNTSISLPAESFYDKSLSHFSSSSTVHIKFNDDGEPINFTEKQKEIESCSEKLSSEVIDNSMNTTIQPSQPEKVLKLERPLDENESLIINDTNHIDVNGTIELGHKLSNSSSMLSQDTILKSPIMTSTKPKVGDLIAFKILRLTENYTPEISKHIIAEILSFNEITLNVDLKIIDGLDQCVHPGGKFFIENNDKDLDSTKSYCWTSLIEPRLIFP